MPVKKATSRKAQIMDKQRERRLLCSVIKRGQFLFVVQIGGDELVEQLVEKIKDKRNFPEHMPLKVYLTKGEDGNWLSEDHPDYQRMIETGEVSGEIKRIVREGEMEWYKKMNDEEFGFPLENELEPGPVHVLVDVPAEVRAWWAGYYSESDEDPEWLEEMNARHSSPWWFFTSCFSTPRPGAPLPATSPAAKKSN